MKHENLIGRRFSMLLILDEVKGKPPKLKCLCDCGKITFITKGSVKYGYNKSCGCLHFKRNGMSGKNSHRKMYNVWWHLIDRCNNPNNKSYKNYGQRGIKVCERWMNFKLFLEDVGERPSPKHSLDRIDNDGNYEPNNIRWATQMQQGNNRVNCVYYDLNGEKLTLRQWSIKLNFPYSVLQSRIRVQKLDIKKAISLTLK